MNTKATLCAPTITSSSTMHRWKITALAAAIATVGLYSGEASALALGKITVKSALGEPLRAEIEVPQITASEADTLQVKTASNATFRAQGMEFSGTASGVQARLQRRANGTAVILLSTARAVNDPFVDYVVDASWNAGQVVRSYTMLLDPPNLKKAEPAVTTAPQIADSTTSAAPRPPVRVIEEPLSASEGTPGRSTTEARGRARAAVAKSSNSPAAAPTSSASSGSGESVRVQRGDTLGRIAALNKPADVSLDQMLVAVVQANPNAFIGGNVNRMKSGVSLTMPSADAARAVTSAQARRMVAAQSRDFNDYRRKLASRAAPADVAVDNRAASGKVEASVKDKKDTAAARDKLDLTKEGAKNKAGKTVEASVAQAETANAAQNRTSELEKNIAAMQEIKDAANAKAAANKPATSVTVPASSPAAVAPAVSAPSEPAVVAAAPVVVAAAPAPVAEPVPAPAVAEPAPVTPPAPAPVEAPAPTPPAPAPAPAPVAVEEPGFVDGLLDNPLTLPLGGGLLALLLGWVGYRGYQRKKAANAMAGDSVMESNLAQDSFFGASGGQHIDTSVSAMTTGASSLAYTPSQLDAGDVDPVAEADVYLAYGRDLQAEEILKEALRTNPTRTTLHAKLAEIYTKRKDRLALEVIAKEARQLTNASGPDWLRIAAMGQGLDPDNGLYHSVAATVPPATAMSAAAVAAAAEAARAVPIQFENTQPPSVTPEPLSDFGPVSGLDFAMSSQLTEAPDEAPGHTLSPSSAFTMPAAAVTAAASTAAAAAFVAPAAPVAPAATMDDFDRQLAEALSIPSELEPSRRGALDNHETEPGSLDFKMSDSENASTAQLPMSDATTRTMDFDMTSLSLELPGSGEPERTHPADLRDDVTDGFDIDDSDPLATKLTLAQEFLAIGDKEGAHSLAQEVLAESTSATIKAQAQRLMEQSR